MGRRVKALIVYGGDTAEDSDRMLWSHCQRLGATMHNLDAEVKIIDLGDWPLPPKNARKSKEIYPEVQGLADLTRWANIIVLATPVHWKFPSALMLLYICHVLCPLEWGGTKGGGYECWGKVGATLVVGDDDGMSTLRALLTDMLEQMAFDKPRWSGHHKNFEMVRSEDDWQNYVESLGPILVAAAPNSRDFPPIEVIFSRAPRLEIT